MFRKNPLVLLVAIFAALSVGSGCDSTGNTSTPSVVAPTIATVDQSQAEATARTYAPLVTEASVAFDGPGPPLVPSRRSAEIDLRALYETRFREIESMLRTRGMQEEDLAELMARLASLTEAKVKRFEMLSQRLSTE